MKIKVAEASGPVLNWLVAKARGFKFGHWQINNASYINVWAELLDDAGCGPAGYFPEDDRFQYSTSWSAGGPIIDREEINLEIHEGGHTRASFYKMRLTFDGRAKHYHHQFGHTPLIAAMRCFVASKLGDEVEVPDELT